MVEQLTVNQLVVGPSPAPGANTLKIAYISYFLFCKIEIKKAGFLCPTNIFCYNNKNILKRLLIFSKTPTVTPIAKIQTT